MLQRYETSDLTIERLIAAGTPEARESLPPLTEGTLAILLIGHTKMSLIGTEEDKNGKRTFGQTVPAYGSTKVHDARVDLEACSAIVGDRLRFITLLQRNEANPGDIVLVSNAHDNRAAVCIATHVQRGLGEMGGSLTDFVSLRLFSVRD